MMAIIDVICELEVPCVCACAALTMRRAQKSRHANAAGSPSLVDGDDGEAPVWVPDHLTRECMLCGSAFSMLNRRHHCACSVVWSAHEYVDRLAKQVDGVAKCAAPRARRVALRWPISVVSSACARHVTRHCIRSKLR
jgi:hypothetical protein